MTMNDDLNPKISTISVENLRLRAYIGFMDWETKKLQDLITSFSFSFDAQFATQNDDVEKSVNYKSLTKQIIKIIDNQHFHLIETLAEEIYTTIQKFDVAIQDIEVKVEKPHALRFTDNVLAKISSKDRYNTAMIALGSNIDAKENFEKALALLQGYGKIVQRTKFISTKPLKFEDQPDFLNGAVLLLTKKSLSALKIELKQSETLLGRVRSDNKNAPRKIDLDVTTYNGLVVDDGIDELPFLKDFLKTLQPEIASYRSEH